METNLTLAKKSKSEMRKAEILRIACSLFANKGYHETTMQDIADSAELTKGGLYYYLKSKEDVLYDIHDTFINEGIRRLKKVEEQYSSPEERLINLFKEHIAVLHDFRDDISLFFRTMSYLNAENYDLVKKQRNEYENKFLKALEDGVKRGVFKEGHSKVATLFILGSVSFMHTWYNPQGKLDQLQLGELFTDLWMNGLKNRKNETKGDE